METKDLAEKLLRLIDQGLSIQPVAHEAKRALQAYLNTLEVIEETVTDINAGMIIRAKVNLQKVIRGER